MTAAEWLASEDPEEMLEWLLTLREWNPSAGDPSLRTVSVSDRRLRLFAVACCRSIWYLLTDEQQCNVCEGTGVGVWSNEGVFGSAFDKSPEDVVKCPGCKGARHINRSRRAVEVAERYADGQVTEEELTAARDAAWAARDAAWAARDAARVKRAALLRDIFGNPFQPVLARCQWCGDVATFGRKCTRCGVEHPWADSARMAQTAAALAEACYQERREDGTLDPQRLAVLADALEEAGCDQEEILRHLRSPGPHVRGCWALDALTNRQ